MSNKRIIQVEDKVPGKLLIPLSLQHMFAMFGASVLVPFLFGINPAIVLFMNGIYTNILNCLDKDSDWFQLSKGDNIFAYVVEEGTTNVQFKIENRTAFEGA